MPPADLLPTHKRAAPRGPVRGNPPGQPAAAAARGHAPRAEGTPRARGGGVRANPAGRTAQRAGFSKTGHTRHALKHNPHPREDQPGPPGGAVVVVVVVRVGAARAIRAQDGSAAGPVAPGPRAAAPRVGAQAAARGPGAPATARDAATGETGGAVVVVVVVV